MRNHNSWGKLWTMIWDDLIIESKAEVDFVEKESDDFFYSDHFLGGAENQSESLSCWQNLDSQWHSGARLSLHWSMCGIDALQLLWTMLHPMNCGMDANQICPTSESGDRLHMCISRRTSAAHCAHIMKSACSLGTQMATRGESIKQLESTQLGPQWETGIRTV